MKIELNFRPLNCCAVRVIRRNGNVVVAHELGCSK